LEMTRLQLQQARARRDEQNDPGKARHHPQTAVK